MQNIIHLVVEWEGNKILEVLEAILRTNGGMPPLLRQLLQIMVFLVLVDLDNMDNLVEQEEVVVGGTLAEEVVLAGIIMPFM